MKNFLYTLLKKVSLASFIFVCLYPFIIIMLISLYPNNEISDGIKNIPFSKLNFDNYISIFKNIVVEDEIFFSLLFTVIISIISSFIIVFLAFFFGFFISRNKSKYINYPLLLAITIYSIPSIFFATYWSFEDFVPIRFIITHFNYLFPFVLLLSVNYFKYVPFAFDRQATMDGITTRYFLTHIIFHYFKPVLFFLFLLVFIIIFNDVLFSTFIANTEEYRFIGHYLIEHYYNTDQSYYKYGELSAYGTLIIIILSISTYLVVRNYQKHIINELKNNL